MTFTIAAISGSLREGSYNTQLLSAVENIAGKDARFTYPVLAEIPSYEEGAPVTPAVQELRSHLGQADAILISTPEYNYSISGVLKNAIDWCSEPIYAGPFAWKPVGVLGAATSFVGTARAQAHLKQILLGLCAQVFPYPEFLLGSAHQKFTEAALTDEISARLLTRYWRNFHRWSSQVNPFQPE